MAWTQSEIQLSPKSRGFHLVTREIVDQLPELRTYSVGMAQVFIMHTSASLTLNENASPDVREDMEAYFNRLVPENEPYYKHTMEGPDDMPAHIKASMLGSSLLLPITNGRFNLGTWQGIYLCEHRDYGGVRRLVITITGEQA
ncbi:MAG: secondary thiamine-phosphate synthase enzyme YjbQ [Rhodothermales bacterium]